MTKEVAKHPGSSIEVVFEHILRDELLALGRRETLAAGATDPEAVHRMRVGLRRMRTILKAFHPVIPRRYSRNISQKMHDVAMKLDDARDIDVFIEELPAETSKTKGGEELWVLAVRFRDTAYGEVRQLVEGMNYRQFKQQLRVWLDTRGWRAGMSPDARSELQGAVGEFSQKVLERRRDRVLKRGRHLDQLDDEGLHKLRIACKDLRYTAEFLDLDGRNSLHPLINQLKQLQDVLGVMHDLVVMNRLQSRLLEGAVSSQLFDCAAKLVDYRKQELATLRGELSVYWEFFSASRFPWEMNQGR